MAEFEFLRAGNSEATEKKALNALFAAASGVLSGLVVTQTTTASGSVLIASGSALVHPSAVSASLLGNDTSKTLDVFTANPVGGLPRNDIVEFDQITATIIVHVGTPNATPTDPTVPATSVALARLRHAASATTIPTAKIDTLIVPTTLRGLLDRAVNTIGAASVGPFTTATPLVQAPTVTADGVKKYKITAYVRTLQGTVATDLFGLTINEIASGLTPSGQVFVTFHSTVSGLFASGLTISVVDTPAAGTRTYRLDGARSAGTGTATAFNPQIIVEQIA